MRAIINYNDWRVICDMKLNEGDIMYIENENSVIRTYKVTIYSKPKEELSKCCQWEDKKPEFEQPYWNRESDD